MQNQKKQDILNIKKTPFNFCDRWCERCDLEERCEVFHHMLTHKLEHIAKGEDPDDLDIVFADMKKMFNKIVKTIEKDLKQKGVDPKQIKVKIIQQNCFNGSEIKKNIILTQSHNFVLNVRKLLTKIYSDYDEESIENFRKIKIHIQELNWYHSLFHAKVYKTIILFNSLKKEKNKLYRSIKQQDLNVCIKLAYNSLTVCERALSKISNTCPGYMHWAQDLLISSILIKEKIETYYPDLHKIKVIFNA